MDYAKAYDIAFKNYSIKLDGKFVKQLFKFCAKGKRKDTVLGTPWYDNGKIYATDSVRLVRLTLNDNCKIDAGAFSFSIDACSNAKSGEFNVNERSIYVKGKGSYHNTIVYSDGEYPNADKLFPKSIECIASPMGFNATFMGDICALAASCNKNTAVKFSFIDKMVYFEFDTRWGKCDGALMAVLLKD